MIPIGGFLTSLGWHSIGQWKIQVGWTLPKIKKKSRKSFDSCCVSLGLILIGIGGIWTTYGWNLRDNQQRKNALIGAVIHEWTINNIRLKKPPLVGNVYVEVYGQEFGTILFPILRQNACESLLASGILDVSKPEDNVFFITLSDYNHTVKVINEIFQMYNDDILHITGEDETKRQIALAEYYQDVIRSNAIMQIMYKCQQNLGEFLKTKYREIYDERFFKMLHEGQPEQEIPNNESAVEPNSREE